MFPKANTGAHGVVPVTEDNIILLVVVMRTDCVIIVCIARRTIFPSLISRIALVWGFVRASESTMGCVVISRFTRPAQALLLLLILNITWRRQSITRPDYTRDYTYCAILL